MDNWRAITMSFKAIFAIGALIAGGVYLFNTQNSPVAKGCIEKKEDPNWSFLSFYNTCSMRINVLFCHKMSVGEFARLFGYNTGDWSCQTHSNVQPSSSITTIKWVNDSSSVASHLLSSSRYRIAACKAPHQPRFVDDGNFQCEK